ncbi:hypothetical protein FACS1894202_12520 [Clostridia bacterium]|nr:hypothetical protein FACS1894202_12520 [Clostridia bacterium]
MDFWEFIGDQRVTGTGFDTFGTEHLVFVLCIAAFLALSCVLFGRLTERNQTIVFRVWTCFTLGLEVFKQIILIVNVRPYPISELTLNLCGLFMFVGVLHAFRPNRVTGELLYCLGLPSALAALLTPDWTRYPVLNYYSLHAFLAHGFLLGAPLLLLTSKRLRPDVRNLRRAAVCLVAAAIPIAVVNSLLDTNFMFLAWAPKGTPLEVFDTWFGFLGSRGYLVGLILLIAVVWTVMYLPWAIAGRKKV